MVRLLQLLILLIISIRPVYADTDGQWELTLSGEDRLEFGTERLAAGLNIRWQTVLHFSIENGQFKQGTGKAQLQPEITPYSRPDGMFECNLVNGIFASNRGQSFATPHLRYQAFPMLGKVVGERIQLNPYLEYPGNYFAILYECRTDNSLGEFWIERSPRVARELNKQQNAGVKVVDSVYIASIKEVKNIPPGPEIDLPLTDGLSFSVSQEYGLRRVTYHLQKLTTD